MKIKSKISIVAAILAVFFAGMAVMLLVLSRTVDALYAKGHLSISISRSASDLLALTYEYSITEEESAGIQWHNLDAALGGSLAQGAAICRAAGEKSMLDRIAGARQKARTGFAELQALDRAVRQHQREPSSQLRHATVAGIIRNLQSIVPLADQLHDRVKADIKRYTRYETVETLVLVFTVIVLVPPGLFLMVHTITNRLDKLRNGMNAVASGDLKVRMDVGSEDEIDIVAKGFNAMTARLEEMTVKRDALANEINERTAQLEAANKELESFSYSVSHDLRAPLRAIDGFIRIVLEDCAGQLDAQGREHLGRVRAASQRMSQLIDDILQLSRISLSEMRLEPMDMSALVSSLADDMRRLEPERQVEFVIEPNLTAHVDANLMRVVLENLLGNAWKFTGKRDYAKIEFGRIIGEDEPVFFVRDNGVGFDMAFAHKMFGAFQRLHATSEFPGSGIGLATVQRVILRHNGRVWAESRIGQGATFYFTLPTESLKP